MAVPLFPLCSARLLAILEIVIAMFTAALPLQADSLAAADISAEESPAKLFTAFAAKWEAREQGEASMIARKLIHLREGALPIMPQLLAFIKELPKGEKVDGTEFSYRQDAAQILASIGAPAALALAEMISKEDAKVSQPVTYVVADELYPLTISFSRFETITTAFDMLAVEALPAAPRLLPLLDSRSAEIRAEACRCLGPIGSLASAAIPRIRALCMDPDEGCRKAALHAFTLIESDDGRLMPLLTAALADKSADVRREAHEIISAIGKTAVPLSDQLIGLFSKSDLDPKELRGPKGRLFAPRLRDLEAGQLLKALQAIGLQNGKQCDALGELLVSGKDRMNGEIRIGISTLLTQAGAMAHPAITRWVSATQDADDETQIAALLAAFTVKPPIEKLAPATIDRALALGRKLIPDKPNNGEGAPRETPPLEMAAFDLVRQIPESSRAATAQLFEVSRRDKGSRELAIALAARMQNEDLAPSIDWLIEQLADDKLERRWQVAAILGKLGPKAAASVPALRVIVDGFEYSHYDPDKVGLAQECYVALARITRDTDRWVKQSEERLLRPMLNERRRDHSSVAGYLTMVTDMGAPAFPYLCRWMSGDDAELASEAMERVIGFGSSSPQVSVAVLSEILKNRRNFDVNKHYEFASFVTEMGPAAAPAMDILIGCVETYRRQTSDSGEEEKLRLMAWSRYFFTSEDQIEKLLAAFRAIGRAEGHKAVPVLLSLYDEEPMKNESLLNQVPVRTEILETLNFLGADLRPLAAKWLPRLVAPLETEYGVRENLLELGAYGRLAISAAPELIRYVRLNKPSPLFNKEALEALGKIAPEDTRVKALRHVGKFAPE